MAAVVEVSACVTTCVQTEAAAAASAAHRNSLLAAIAATPAVQCPLEPLPATAVSSLAASHARSASGPRCADGAGGVGAGEALGAGLGSCGCAAAPDVDLECWPSSLLHLHPYPHASSATTPASTSMSGGGAAGDAAAEGTPPLVPPSKPPPPPVAGGAPVPPPPPPAVVSPVEAWRELSLALRGWVQSALMLMLALAMAGPGADVSVLEMPREVRRRARGGSSEEEEDWSRRLPLHPCLCMMCSAQGYVALLTLFWARLFGG